ncbi:MAG: hypothetical protein HN742_24140 [Lentisphaerae bacterium]|jgi:hypothetical protein|nr:hypothetical protein [Lentisphaerota bacterium]MBT4815107.1 hypothetical protein [Lentisphaerota bacterium]MBT5611562.1 hypothetical protein [Lentisphaerota bacterium]MBT7059589.1 hypothetical protein [Lentisphaerota bacterium]MBT7844989.1 hypothetical protein [Lentisphaerota bacterium]
MARHSDSTNTPLRSRRARRKLVAYLGERSGTYFSARDLAAKRVRRRRTRLVLAALAILIIGLMGAWKEWSGGAL